MVRYSVHLGNSLRRERSDPETPVLAIVLYHGPGPLVVEVQPIEPLAAIDPEVEAMVRGTQAKVVTYHDDLSLNSETDLLERGMTALATLTLLSLRFLPGQDPASTIASIDRWGHLLQAVDSERGPPVGCEAIENFGWYVLHVTEASPQNVHMAIQRHLKRPEENIVSTAERLRREGKAEGKTEGKAEGKAEGKIEGELNGRAATLQRQLVRRFGPLPKGIEPRLHNGTVAELEHWADRVLDAHTLDEVFASE